MLRRWIDRRRGIVARTKTGKPMRDADIQTLADEAEAGYDVSHLICEHDWHEENSETDRCKRCGAARRGQ